MSKKQYECQTVKEYNQQFHPLYNKASSFASNVDHALQKSDENARMQMRVIGWGEDTKHIILAALDLLREKVLKSLREKQNERESKTRDPSLDRIRELIKNMPAEQTSDELAAYLLTNGIIAPPCKVGDHVFYVHNSCDEDCDERYDLDIGEVYGVSSDSSGIWVYCRYRSGLNYYHKESDFGKTVFLDKAQAEKILMDKTSGSSLHWIDNADSYICPICAFECDNPNRYEGCKCPQCGFQDEKDKADDEYYEMLADLQERVQLVERYDANVAPSPSSECEVTTYHSDSLSASASDICTSVTVEDPNIPRTPTMSDKRTKQAVIAEFATSLNGRTYGQELTPEEEHLAKELGIVIVFGYSDDNAEFRGALSDEIGCFNGGRIFERDETYIDAVWCDGEYSWTFHTNIPHATFDIYDEDGKYCRGIVFALENK